MAKVNKVDFYCGAFLSYLISNKVEPTLFNANEKSKVVQFLLKNTDYNVYVKYVSAGKLFNIKGKQHTRWEVIFQKSERDYLVNDFCKSNFKNIVVLVCANKDFKDTYFAILTYDQAIQCLGNDAINNQFRISVKHQKKSPNAYCYGTALSDNNAIAIPYNVDTFFGFNDKVVATT